ncbi:MAG: hypothetical protein L6Q37_07505 [Bdellovibrionaceae bacterium]|nr:hypothetical protein [Pseudobdellovibrionaceae bacterium]NUM57722.1 hypothetical protein [Pseudobdellovibrionaceae bacterium]
MRKNQNISLICVTFFLVLFISEKTLCKGQQTSLISIPVRLNVFAGYLNGSSSFNLDKKNISNNGFLGGIDFNVPIPAINTLIGGNMWFLPAAKSDDINSKLLFIGPYLGYSKGKNDLFIGLGVAVTESTLKETAAAPNTEISLSKNIGCGFLGWRNYFGKSQTMGVGLTGYACQASDYSKVVDSQTAAKITVADKASLNGALLFLFFSWGEERTLI